MTRREYHELERLRATPVGKSREEIDRWCALEYRHEQAWKAEVYSAERWERWRPALRTLADVLFWVVAVPFLVLMAFNGRVGTGSMMIVLLWLGLRCDWALWLCRQKGKPE